MAKLNIASVVALALLTSCGLVQFKGTVTTTKTVNGKTETKEREFENWDEFKTAMDESAADLKGTTKELITKLTEAPPPGQVKLADLSAGLASYEGHASCDFLAKADAEEFTYVQIGVPTYDQFFKASAEFYAFVFQTRESVRRLRELARASIKGEVDASISLRALVDSALQGEASADASVSAELRELNDLTIVLARSTPAFVQKTQQLVAAGQQLIAGAAASITHPKTVIHLDLITQGLGHSVKVVGSSGKLLGEMTAELATL